MEVLELYLDYILHIDRTIKYLIDEFGLWIYVVLFAVIFSETALVIFSFLPGDSLLFASGAFAGADADLNIWLLVVGFFLAATGGDLVNFHFGRFTGQHIPENSLIGKMISPERLAKAQQFFERHGAITIIAARFMPVFRAIIPFVAGASQMPIRRFMKFNMIGALIWGVGCTLLGYWFGNIPWVKDNFTIVLVIIMFTTFFPPILTTIRAKS